MKCCASQTTYTTNPVEKKSPRGAAVAFEALLFAQVLKPMAKTLGFYGETALDACANEIARNERGVLAEKLERLFTSSGAA
jgi:hypothetical protein